MATRVFTARQFAKLVNRQVSTLYNWTYTKKLIPLKDMSGRLLYTDEHYKAVTGLDLQKDD